jgi:predicted RNA binding protein YcfA (HicA-like mRNA interferase family)
MARSKPRRVTRVAQPLRPAYDVLRRHGWTVEQSRGGHVKWRDAEGRVACSCPLTPSDYRSMKNTLAQLRRAAAEQGIELPR